MMSVKEIPFYVCLILSLSASSSLSAQYDIDLEMVEDSLINEGPWATPDMAEVALLDSLLMTEVEREYLNVPIDSIRMTREELLAIPDSLFITRLAALDGMSPFRLDYNKHVHSSILAYLGANVEGTALCLGRSELYFPMFEEILDREGLPLELKYLAIVESALRPTAKSRAGATGLWQFMYGTAKENGLRIDSYVDERKSPIASTEAACKYLKKLYRMYGDWNLALAAYNSGPGNVNKAIRRAGGKQNYWAIWSYLPRETRGYVPAFIAVNYVMNFYEDHGILPIEPERRFAECDTLMVKGPIDFSQIATYTGTSMDDLYALNPQYTKGHIPNSGVEEALTLPRTEVGAYLMNSNKIKNFKAPIIPATAAPVHTAAAKATSPYSTEGKDKYTYTVRSGDVLGVIASKNGVSISKLRYWNKINGSRIYPGQKLVIYKEEGTQAVAADDTPSPTKTPKEEGIRYHTIRSGDTLWDIAQKYQGISVDQIKKWNSHLDFKRLKPGQKVRVS